MAVQWVFLDAFGTLVLLDRVFERLQANLQALGHPLPLADVERAARKEFAYYVAHSRAGREAESLQRLRLECAAELLEGFRERGHPLPVPAPEMATALIGALEFRLYPDVTPTLAALSGRGKRLGVISNWDYTLPGILRRLGLGELLEVVAVSSLCDCDKPGAAIFLEALRLAGAPPESALHVGDSYGKDVLGARGVGMNAGLLDRRGESTATDVPVIHDLRELLALV